MRVAFEVESSTHWKDELCKLAHIVSDLCVLAAYQAHATWLAEDALQEYLVDLGDRVTRVPGREWLFIFGPKPDKLFDPWRAFTLDKHRHLVPLTDETPLRGCDLAGPSR
jgi:hypothetical protein